MHLTVRYDERTGTVLAIGALDNLVKGASGQALQNANLVLGLPETTAPPHDRTHAMSSPVHVSDRPQPGYPGPQRASHRAGIESGQR